MKSLQIKADLCNGCSQCEIVCSTGWFKEANRDKSAILVSEKNSTYKINVCNQCGECIDTCPTLALYKNKEGIVILDKEKCVGCFSCIGFCPRSSMRNHRDYMEPFKCIACGKCAKECPTGALTIEDSIN